MGLVLLIFGLVLLANGNAPASLISDIPGTSKIEEIVDTRELMMSSGFCLVILGLVIIGISVLAFFGVLCKVTLVLYLVSIRLIA